MTNNRNSIAVFGLAGRSLNKAHKHDDGGLNKGYNLKY